MRVFVMLAVSLLASGTAAASARGTTLARWDVPSADAPSLLTTVGVAGPVLAGDRVAWARGASMGDWTIAAAVPGRPPRTVAVLTRRGESPTGLWHALALAGSPTRLAWTEVLRHSDRSTLDAPVFAQVVAGAPAGPFAPVVASCAPGQPALAGDTLVFDDVCGGGERTARAVALGGDVAPPAAAAELPAPAARAFAGRAAGRLLLLDGSRLGVAPSGQAAFDLDTGRALGPYPVAGAGGADETALQADGKLASVATAAGGRLTGVVWRAPGDPAVHPIGVPIADPGRGRNLEDPPRVLIAADRLLVRARSRTGQQLVVADLAGHAAPLVRFGGLGTLLRPAARPLDYAFDGTRVAWSAVQCEHVTIGTTTVGHPVAVPRTICDAPRVVGSRARMARDGRFGLAMTCARGCRGRLVLRFVDAHGAPLGPALAGGFALRGSTAVRHVALRIADPRQRARVHAGHARLRVDVHGADRGSGRTVTIRPLAG